MSDCKPCCEPYSSCCWPDDKHFGEGAVELRVPSSAALGAVWHAAILDTNGVPPGSIIKSQDGFDVLFRVELSGELWQCITGCWCFDLGFTAIGEGTNFDLSRYLGRPKLELKDWKGCGNRCEHGPGCANRFKVELQVHVPPNTIPAPHCGIVYECAARASFFCCCCEEEGHGKDDYVHTGRTPILTGYDSLEEREFYS